MIKSILPILYILFTVASTNTIANIVTATTTPQPDKNALVEKCVDFGVFMEINLRDSFRTVIDDHIGYHPSEEDFNTALKSSGFNLETMNKCATLDEDNMKKMKDLVEADVASGKYDNLLIQGDTLDEALIQVAVVTCVDMFVALERKMLISPNLPTDEDIIQLKIDFGYDADVILACDAMKAKQTFEFLDLLNEKMMVQ